MQADEDVYAKQKKQEQADWDEKNRRYRQKDQDYIREAKRTKLERTRND